MNIYVFFEYTVWQSIVYCFSLSLSLSLSTDGDMFDKARFDMKEKINCFFFPGKKLFVIKLCTKLKANAKSNTLWGTNFLDRERKGKRNSQKTWFPVSCPNIQKSHLKWPKLTTMMIIQIALKTKPSEDSVWLLGGKKRESDITFGLVRRKKLLLDHDHFHIYIVSHDQFPSLIFDLNTIWNVCRPHISTTICPFYSQETRWKLLKFRSSPVFQLSHILLSIDLWALFTSKKFCKIGIVALSFVFDKYCLIMD